MRLLAAILILTFLPLMADDLGDELLSATRKGDVAQVKALLDKGANVNAKTRYEQTPLFFACDRGNLELAKLLIERGADLNVQDNFYHATPLTWAMEKKNKEMIALLVTKGVNPADALRQSILFNNKELFQLILDKGKTDAAMLTDALLMTETAKKTEMSDALKAKGAKPVAYQLDPAALSEYAGSFTDGGSSQLEFLVKDGNLTFAQMGGSLVPIEKDAFRFVAQGLTFQFQRDNNGKISGFKLPGRGGDTVYTKTTKDAAAK